MKTISPMHLRSSTYQRHGKFLLCFIASFFLSFIMMPVYAQSSSPGTGAVPDAMQVLNRIAEQLPALTGFVYALVYMMGLGFIIAGIVKLKHVGEQRSMMSMQHGWGGAMMYMLVGTLLLFLPSTLQVGTGTFWSTPCSYCYPTEPDSPFTSFFKVVYAVVNFVGLIAFVRGLVILSHLGEQSQHGGFARAMTHIVGGILCMNIGAFVQTIFATLGIKL